LMKRASGETINKRLFMICEVDRHMEIKNK